MIIEVLQEICANIKNKCQIQTHSTLNHKSEIFAGRWSTLKKKISFFCQKMILFGTIGNRSSLESWSSQFIRNFHFFAYSYSEMSKSFSNMILFVSVSACLSVCLDCCTHDNSRTEGHNRKLGLGRKYLYLYL